jgi:hypothetical protein
VAGRHHPVPDARVDPDLIARMNRVRADLPVLRVLPSECLPSPGHLSLSVGRQRIAEAAFAMARPCPDKPLGRLIARSEPARIAFDAVAANPRASDGHVHDAYFAVARGDADDPTVQFDGILAAVVILWREAQDRSSVREDLEQLASGLALAFCIATGHHSVAIGLPAPDATAGDRFAAAATRWLRGHQIFLVLIQAMIQIVATLTQRPQRTDRDAALAMLTTLFEASAAAMRHTGNFDPDIYDRMIRPSMAPPHIVNGFSGLFSSDHRQLVQLLRSEGDTLRQGAFACPHLQQQMITALGRLYDNHGAVCAQFVGAQEKSLLVRKDVNATALQQIEKFKKSRVRLISPG